MVLHLPRNESARVGALETIGSDKVLQSPDLGPAGCLPIAIQRSDKSGAQRDRPDKGTVDC